jgi:hypothetical protein
VDFCFSYFLGETHIEKHHFTPAGCPSSQDRVLALLAMAGSGREGLVDHRMGLKMGHPAIFND